VGVKKDVKSAIAWYEKAADNNHPIAQHSIGYIYYSGLDYRQDFEKAYRWLRLAADNGYADSCYAIGLMHYHGQGFAQNINEAIKWFEKAVRFGKAEVCRLLGNLYHENNTSTPDNARALMWFEKGAELDDSICAFLAGVMYYDGTGCRMDYKEAFKYYLQAANKGMVDACVEVANMLVNGEGVGKDTIMAEKWLQRAVYYGHEHAPKLLKIVQDINGTTVKSAVRTRTSSSSVGSSLGGTTYTRLSDIEAKAEIELAQNREKRQGIMRAAGARTGGHSYGDEDFGYIFSEDGEVAQYVDFNTGMIFDSNGRSAYYDEKTKTTYDTRDGSLSYYDETFDMTYNLKTGEKSYHTGGMTYKW
jgi:tetratricopeptide (TPR) repeat protein